MSVSFIWGKQEGVPRPWAASPMWAVAHCGGMRFGSARAEAPDCRRKP